MTTQLCRRCCKQARRIVLANICTLAKLVKIKNYRSLQLATCSLEARWVCLCFREPLLGFKWNTEVICVQFLKTGVQCKPWNIPSPLELKRGGIPEIPLVVPCFPLGKTRMILELCSNYWDVLFFGGPQKLVVFLEVFLPNQRMAPQNMTNLGAVIELLSQGAAGQCGGPTDANCFFSY